MEHRSRFSTSSRELPEAEASFLSFFPPDADHVSLRFEKDFFMARSAVELISGKTGL